MRRLWIAAWLLLCLAAGAQAEPAFPALSGRIVDQAGLLDAATRERLEERLARHERATGQQLVVATLLELGGEAIEDYGYRLGRHWGIGRAGEDDGALLIVALAERRVRIEVGYGLEGTLTDALSSRIIQRAILPAFREGDFAGGIEAGVSAMLALLGEAGAEPHTPVQVGEERSHDWLLILMIMVIVTFSFGGGFGRMAPGVGRRRGVLLPGPGGFGGGRGGFGGGGFGGGGGGFGGGGASGGW